MIKLMPYTFHVVHGQLSSMFAKFMIMQRWENIPTWAFLILAYIQFKARFAKEKESQ
jgi:hypothetical protein